MQVLDLFSGIGGFSLGLERAGMKTVAFCEIEPYCQKVLRKHWPDVPIYDDVKELTGERLRADGIGRIDVITGGFPCQDISVAGKQKGIEAERSGLWSELARIIGDIRPSFAIVENVTALLSGDRGRWFGRVLGDLVEIGYDAEWHCIPASELGAHHHRDRVWIIAYTTSCEQPSSIDVGKFKRSEAVASTRAELIGSGSGFQALAYAKRREQQVGRVNARTRWVEELDAGISGAIWDAEPAVGRVAHGIPRTMDRLRGLGNAVVPQIPELIGRAIMRSNSHAD